MYGLKKIEVEISKKNMIELLFFGFWFFVLCFRLKIQRFSSWYLVFAPCAGLLLTFFRRRISSTIQKPFPIQHLRKSNKI